LHGVAPWALHGDSNIVVPWVTEGWHVAELARDRLATDAWIARDDAWLPVRLAVGAAKSSLIEVCIVAELALSGCEAFANSTIHVDFENPVPNLISLRFREDVLLWDWDLMGLWDVRSFKVLILLDETTIWVLDSIPKINVPVEKDEGHIVVSNLSVGITGIKECLVSPNFLDISQERSAKLSIDSVEIVLSSLTLEKGEMGHHQVLHELLINWIVLVIDKTLKILDELLEHLSQDLQFNFIDSSKSFL
jgi:hypothetical protein